MSHPPHLTEKDVEVFVDKLIVQLKKEIQDKEKQGYNVRNLKLVVLSMIFRKAQYVQDFLTRFQQEGITLEDLQDEDFIEDIATEIFEDLSATP